MKKGIFSIVTIVLVFLSGLLVFPVSSETVETTDTDEFDWYVDDIPGEGPDNPVEDFTSIQDAIDNASSGDTVFVYNGEYYENIKIEKNIQINVVGENKDNTIIDGGGSGNVIEIGSVFNIDRSPEVFLNNFTIQNCGDECAGILSVTKNNRISNNYIKSNFFGVYFHSTSSNNEFSNNEINSNEIGIEIRSVSNIVRKNVITKNTKGVSLKGTKNYIFDNSILNNEKGIFVRLGANEIFNNSICNNDIGLYFDSKGSNSNNISYNNISNNKKGVSTGAPSTDFYSCRNSFYHNNFIDNSENSYYFLNERWSSNYWDDWIGLTSEGERLQSYIEKPIFRFFYNLYLKYFLRYPALKDSTLYYKIPGAPEDVNPNVPRYFNIDWNPASEPYDI